MSTALTQRETAPSQNNVLAHPAAHDAAVLESLILNGDLSQLSPPQKVQWYQMRCEAAGLDPVTKPFDYLRLSGKEVLYATKTCTEQLCEKRKLSTEIVDENFANNLYRVRARVIGPDGRHTDNIGVVSATGGGDAMANAMMKAVTKAFRRAVLSHCGMGMLDETEIETIHGARTGSTPGALPQAPPPVIEEPRATSEQIEEYNALRKTCGELGLKVPCEARENMAAGELAVWIRKTREKVEAQQALNRESIPTTPPTIHQPATTTANAADSFQKTKAARVAQLADEYENSDDDLDADFQNAVARDSDEFSEGEIVDDEIPFYGEVTDGDYQGVLPAPPQGALVFEIPGGTPRAKCRSCDADVFWIQTKNGKKMPANPDGTSHFSTCPNANQHRAESESKHLAALLIAAQKAGFSTERETMIAAINRHMASPHFRPIQSRKQLSKLQCDLLINAIEGGFLTWEKASEGGAA
jgi:hypothetical protein